MAEVKFIQNVTQDTELNRVQNNVAEALRHLRNEMLLAIGGGDSCCDVPAPGVIPVGTRMILEWSGINDDNAGRHMWVGAGGGDIGSNGIDGIAGTQLTVPFDGTVQTLIVGMNKGFPDAMGAGNDCDFIVRKNGVGNNPAFDSSLRIDLGPADIGGSNFLDAAPHQSFSVVAGDLLGVYYNQISMGGWMTKSIPAGRTSWFVSARCLLVST